RQAVLAAGFPVDVPGTSIDRQCGSSRQAAHVAAQGVIAGAYDVVIAGGVESMSRVPMLWSAQGVKPQAPVRRRFPNPAIHGIGALLFAARCKLDRGQLDAYAAQSHLRASESAA